MVGLGAKPTFISLNPLAHFTFYNFSHSGRCFFLCGEKLKIMYSRRVFLHSDFFTFFFIFTLFHFFTFFTFSDFFTFLHFYIFTTFRFFHFFIFFSFSLPLYPLSGYPGDMKKKFSRGVSQSSPNPILL